MTVYQLTTTIICTIITTTNEIFTMTVRQFGLPLAGKKKDNNNNNNNIHNCNIQQQELCEISVKIGLKLFAAIF